ncbi:endonuclease domain-containing protein [Butyrivibrio sp. WCD3002]|uniref:endonuclease domain-containing protein n=1 Tax=Butyrivibrio sp. WCD3002 TaxID=1280676 RepID=UPI00047B9EAE|nr:endonuclease domain-containing protein [Butyrivibrio sp. WCD3002]
MTDKKELTQYSQKLRKEMTKEERHLWYDFLKGLDISIRRQKVVGNYILDFYYPKKKVAIELDGSQHFEKEGRDKDIIRDNFLKERGITVLRYSNYDINMNFEAVCEDIARKLGGVE